MELATFQYNLGKKWSVSTLPDLDSTNTLVLIFAAPEFYTHPQPFAELAKAYPLATLIGCSSAGEIAGVYVRDQSISVAVIRFKETRVKATFTDINQNKDAFLAGKQIANTLSAADLRSIFVLSDGLNVNGTELTKGLNTATGNDVVITGGLASDGDQFKNTWTILNGKVMENTIVAVGLYGQKIKIGHGSRGGWDIFGPERRVTRSKNNILYELDNKPALALYKEYLGERSSGLPATGLLFPLAIRKDIKDARQLVRTILAIDEPSQSLIFAGDIPTGYLAQLMRANFDRLINGANEAAQLASVDIPFNEATNERPILSIAISCVGRRLLLGERIEEETESTLEALPKFTQQIGFYSYDELSPFATGSCDLHNQTMTITTLYEDP
jgi:hypothetical protein